MKIICTTKKVIEETKSCKKEYCCKDLEVAMNTYYKKRSNSTISDDYYPNIELNKKDKFNLVTHGDYDCRRGHEMNINYCPFCGVKLTVEHKLIDETGLPPEMPVQKKAEKKKRHWWGIW